MHSNEIQEIQEAHAGDICAIFGLECASGNTCLAASLDRRGHCAEHRIALRARSSYMSLAVKLTNGEMWNTSSKVLARFLKRGSMIDVNQHSFSQLVYRLASPGNYSWLRWTKNLFHLLPRRHVSWNLQNYMPLTFHDDNVCHRSWCGWAMTRQSTMMKKKLFFHCFFWCNRARVSNFSLVAQHDYNVYMPSRKGGIFLPTKSTSL